jgi:transcription elongation factor Elf1
MKKDNVLKKEFQKKDVERLRNLVKGKHGDKTTLGIGYTKKQEYYHEGDVWEEDGRTWTIKNGLKQNVTKLDSFKQIANLPLFCPSCNKLMKKHLDKKVYPAYQKCFDCVVDFEAELQRQGKLEEYYNNLHNQNIDKTIKEYKAFMEDQLNNVSNQGFVTEAGDVEKWVGGDNKEELLKNLQEGLDFLEGLKK